MSKKLGRLPADLSLPKLQLKFSATPTPPASAGWYSELPADWGMMGNDTIGDCVAAGAGHFVEEITEYGQGTETVVPDDEVIKMYSAISGYDPTTGANDNGAMLQDGLNYLHKTGLSGHKIAAFAQLKVQDLNEVRNCINLFGSAYVGLNVSQAMMDQFDNGQPWDYVKRSPNLGGHCVLVVGYDEEYFYVVTWGQVQKVTLACWAHNFDEAWVPISQDWINAHGTDAGGVDVATLNADYQALTGNAGPFQDVTPTPDPTPTPVPDPTPTPVPNPTPSDSGPSAVDLAEAISAFLSDWSTKNK